MKMKTLSIIIIGLALGLSFNSAAKTSDKNCKCCNEQCTESKCCNSQNNSVQGTSECCSDKCTNEKCTDCCKDGKCSTMSDTSLPNKDANNSNESIVTCCTNNGTSESNCCK